MMVGEVGFEPTVYLMCRIYSPVPLRRRSRSPLKLFVRRQQLGFLRHIL